MCKIELRFSGKNIVIILSSLALIFLLVPILMALTSKNTIPVGYNYTGVVIFYFIGISIFIYLFWICINMVREIKVDENSIYILKSKEFRTIPFSQMKHITYSTGRGGGIYFFWIRKKDEIENIETSFFTISALLGSNKNYRKLLLNKLEQRTTLKKSKII